MFASRDLPTPSSIISAYASISTSLMLVRTITNDLIPQPLRGHIIATIQALFKGRSSTFTLTIEEFNGISKNEVFEASEAYLSTRLSPDTEGFKISKGPKEKSLTIHLEHGEKIVDHFQGIELTWNFRSVEHERREENQRGGVHERPEKRSFKLRFEKCHKDVVLNSYIPYVLEKAKSIKDEKRALKIFTLGSGRSYGGPIWDPISLEHPATFDTIAMDPDKKKAIIEDLDRFTRRRDFYKSVGRAWKRGYLLYGPPGTGKTSLVAAMANHLKFDLYDLQPNNVLSDSDLRRLFLTIGNRSILVIEDIDCSVDLRRDTMPAGDTTKKSNTLLTLSGFLNSIDGLWSSCGDEKILVFTTNHIEKLDPALIRPGRMDMHIEMSYCRFEAFEDLASVYLGLPRGSRHRLYGEIKNTIEEAKVTPAQIAEEMMRSENADVALDGVVKLLKRKRLEDDGVENESDGAKIGIQESKKAKLDSEENVTH